MNNRIARLKFKQDYVMQKCRINFTLALSTKANKKIVIIQSTKGKNINTRLWNLGAY